MRRLTVTLEIEGFENFTDEQCVDVLNGVLDRIPDEDITIVELIKDRSSDGKKPPSKPPDEVKLFAKLEPLTKQREVVACEMGMRFGFVASYKPQYFLRDTIIVLWLRSIPVSKVDQAEEDPKAAMREALKWAEAKGIGIDTPAFSEGYSIFMATMKEAQAAKGEPVLPPDTAREQDEGEL